MDGPITSVFGHRLNPVLNKEEFHDGIDIAVKTGTPVGAVRDGVVTEAGWSGTFGNYIIFITGDGFEIKYAHLSKVFVNAGEFIKKGQIVAESGNTGLSTGPHLHYGIRSGEDYVDPSIYVGLEYTTEARRDYLSALGSTSIKIE